MVNEYMMLLVLSVVVASCSQILLKKSAGIQYSSLIREYLNPYVIIGYTMMVGSTILTVMAYAGLEYKNGPIIESLGFVLIMFLSRAFFAEKITKKKLLGNSFILLGIIIYYL